MHEPATHVRPLCALLINAGWFRPTRGPRGFSQPLMRNSKEKKKPRLLRRDDFYSMKRWKTLRSRLDDKYQRVVEMSMLSLFLLSLSRVFFLRTHHVHEIAHWKSHLMWIVEYGSSQSARVDWSKICYWWENGWIVSTSRNGEASCFRHFVDPSVTTFYVVDDEAIDISSFEIKSFDIYSIQRAKSLLVYALRITKWSLYFKPDMWFAWLHVTTLNVTFHLILMILSGYNFERPMCRRMVGIQ